MSLRIDTTEWIADSLIIGDVGLGVLGSEIPATGDHGAGYAYNDLDLPNDANKEICGRITTWPSAGTLFAYEDTSFEFSGPDGTYSFQYQLYVDGVATGSPVTVTLQVGGVTHATSGALSASAASISGAALRFVSHAASGSLLADAASLAGSAARLAGVVTHSASGALSASVAQVSGSVTRIGGPSVYPSSGNLQAGAAQLSGVAARIAALVTHDTSGALAAQSAQAFGLSMNGLAMTVARFEIDSLMTQSVDLHSATVLRLDRDSAVTPSLAFNSRIGGFPTP